MAHGNQQHSPLAPRSKFYHGPFGRLFPELPAWRPKGVLDGEMDEHLHKIAKTMVEKPDELPSTIASKSDMIKELEEKFDSTIPAGYTYFGQFIDHDITFDPSSSLMRQNDPNRLLNFRTPRLDLDSLYGAGRAEQPYLYEQNKKIPDFEAKLAIGHVKNSPDLPDLPRYNQRALIGDHRNDENAIISQLQVAFILAHNNLVDRARAESPEAKPEELFERARCTLQWLYQYIVWNDFIRLIAADEVYASALRLESLSDGRRRWVCGFEDIYHWRQQPFMPVEFSVAAYRFGHSMVRNSYQTNSITREEGKFVPIFNNSATSDKYENLRGFRSLNPENCIQWDWFLSMDSSEGGFPQKARKIDPFLANALAFLHVNEKDKDNELNVLAFRNLKRGITFDLPSGTEVAKRLGVDPLKLENGEPDALWYYLLREAEGNRADSLGESIEDSQEENEKDDGGNKLGPVGSIIVCSVFAGLLKGDPRSFFSMEPCWTPDKDPLLQQGAINRGDEPWALSSIIRLAGIKADGIGLEQKQDNAS